MYEFRIREKLSFFSVDNNYVDYLEKYDQNVCHHYDGKRLYIGVLFEVNNKKYLAPLTSAGKNYLLANKKYRRIVYKIDDGNYGFVRIGNMIPVSEEVVTPIHISQIDDDFYKNLLLNQYMFLRKEYVVNEIRNLAEKLYKNRYENDNYFLADIMCDYKKDEQLLEKYLLDLHQNDVVND